MAFLKTLLFILLGYYLLKIVARFFAPRLISYAIKKTEARFKQAFEGFDVGGAFREERYGDVIINKTPKTKTRKSENVGEYIEFEEID